MASVRPVDGDLQYIDDRATIRESLLGSVNNVDVSFDSSDNGNRNGNCRGNCFYRKGGNNNGNNNVRIKSSDKAVLAALIEETANTRGEKITDYIL